MWTNGKWTPDPLSDHLALLRTNVVKLCGVTTEVEDQAYILARLLLVFAERIAAMDRNLAEAMSLLDEAVAAGPALEIVAWRWGLRRAAARKTQGRGRVHGANGLVLAGQQFRHKATGRVWQVDSKVTIVSGGTALALFTCVDYGPVPVPSDGGDVNAWTLVSQVPGGLWTGVTVLVLVSLGRDLETDDQLRARVQRVKGVSGGIERAITAGLEAVSGVGAGGVRVTVNRTNETQDEIPSRYVEAVLSTADAGAEDVGLALLGTLEGGVGGASGTAGFFGNRFVLVPHPQTGEDYEVAYSVVTVRRLFAQVTATITGAPVPPSSNLAALIGQYAQTWSETLGGGDAATAVDLQAAIGVSVPAGMLVDVEAQVSLDGVTFFNIIKPPRREKVHLSAQPSAATIIGAKAPAYTIMAGWHLDYKADGGATQIVTFNGTETTLDDVLAAFVAAGLSGIVAAASAINTLQVSGVTLGTGATLQLMNTTTLQLLLVFGVVTGTVTGRASDVTVTLV